MTNWPKLKLISWDINQKFKSEVRESPQRSIVTHRVLNWIVPTVQRNYWNSEWLKIEFKWDQLSDSTWVWFRTWAEIQIETGNSWAERFWGKTNFWKYSIHTVSRETPIFDQLWKEILRADFFIRRRVNLQRTAFKPATRLKFIS